MKAYAFILLLGLLAFAYSSGTDDTHFPTLKGPMVETNNATLNIRIVPHTHDDIGWLKTVDQYYYDSEKQITIQGVQYILDSVFPVLQVDPSKRFIYVEMGFFQRWWNEQSDAVKEIVRQLTNSGQFEFINGGYCMNDEADVYYEDSIDQMTLGHQFILENFGVTPEIGWHIDPFGHASAQAALFAQMGFKAFFFARIDYQDKQKRLQDKAMEMVWIPNTSQGIENAMFTHVNYYHYSNPQGFNFDIIASDQPIRDDPNLEEYDVPQRADQYVAWFRQMAGSYRTNDLMHTAGEDFEYMAAHVNFKNNDKLFKYIRNNPSYNVNVSYNTPSEYLSAIYPQNVQYPTKTDDFFPYADGDNAYWTGYFTSRVAVKGLVREQGRLLQAARRLATQALWEQTSQFIQNNFAQVDKAIYKLEEAMAIGQHHDAVTGTEKQAVSEDYKLYFAKGSSAIHQDFLNPFFQERVQEDLGLAGAQFETCNLNTSAVFCNVTTHNLLSGTNVLIAIYNSGSMRQSTIRVKIPNGNVQVTLTNGTAIPTDVICSNSTDTSDCDLFFTQSFNSFDISYYYLTPSSQSNLVNPQSITPNQAYNINVNQTISVAQNLSAFTLNYCQDSSHQDCYTTQFNLNYNFYESYSGNDQNSGAYIFRPSTKTFRGSIPYASPVSAKIYLGKNLLQIHVDSKIILTDIRIYQDISNGVEVQTFIDSIPINDNVGKEIIMQVQVPSINNNNTFYTDSMGMELQTRVLNYRPTWKLNVTQPTSGNYYPIQSIIAINDTQSGEGLAVIPDRAQAGSSLFPGEIELMIHRRTLRDDGRGVGEPMNETDWDGKGMRQWVTHTLVFSKHKVLKTHPRVFQLDRDTANIVLFAPMSKTAFLEMPKRVLGDDSFMVFDPQAKLMSRPISPTKFLLRFQNMDDQSFIEVSTDCLASNKLGKGVPVEMSLTANQAKSDMIKKRFNWNGLELNNPSFVNTDYLNSNLFLLRPLEIRTFIVDFSKSNKEEIIYI